MKSFLRLSLAAAAIVIIAVVAVRWMRYGAPTIEEPPPPATPIISPTSVPKASPAPAGKLVGAPVDTVATNGSRWISEVHVQNVGTEPTDVSLTMYPASGGQEQQTKSKTAAPGAGVIFRAGQDVPAGFSGSAVVNSTSQAVRATVFWQDATGRARSTYAGAPAAEGKMYLPLVRRLDEATTTLFVQNAGAEAAKVTVQFFSPDGQGQTFQDDQVLAPGRSRSYQVPPALAAFQGSAAVSADPAVPLAVAYRDMGQGGRMFSGNGLDATWQGMELHAPVVQKHWLGWSSAIYVQNTGDKPAKVTVTYKSYATGKEYVSSIGEGKGLPPGATRVYASDPVLPGDAKTLLGFRGSAIIKADQPVAAVIVSESPGRASALAHTAIPKEAASSQAVVPLVRSYWMGAVTGIVVRNVGAAPAKVSIQYRSSVTGKEYPGPSSGEPLAPGASRAYYLHPPMPDSGPDGSGFIGAATIIADQPIVVTYDELFVEEDRNTVGGNGQNIYP